MQGKTLNAIVTIIVGFAMVFTVNAYQIDCPKSIDVKEKVENMSDGWGAADREEFWKSGFVKNISHKSTGVGVFLGEPLVVQKSEDYVLNNKKGFKKYRNEWDVSLRPEDTDRYYASCFYYNSEVVLVKKIDTSMKSCWTDVSLDELGNEINSEHTLYCSTNKRGDNH